MLIRHATYRTVVSQGAFVGDKLIDRLEKRDNDIDEAEFKDIMDNLCKISLAVSNFSS